MTYNVEHTHGDLQVLQSMIRVCKWEKALNAGLRKVRDTEGAGSKPLVTHLHRRDLFNFAFLLCEICN